MPPEFGCMLIVQVFAQRSVRTGLAAPPVVVPPIVDVSISSLP